MGKERRIMLVSILIVLAGWGSTPSALGIGGAFTYQGRLKDGGSPANGEYDIVFTLYNEGGADQDAILFEDLEVLGLEYHRNVALRLLLRGV